MSHTIGPWSVATDDKGFWLTITNHQSLPIAGRIGDCADAALIAAAPDLLAALRCALADLEGALQAHRDGDPHGHDWKAHALSIDEARAAIAKATGGAA